MKDIITVGVETPEGSSAEPLDDHEKMVDNVVLIPQPSADPNDPLVCISALEPQTTFDYLLIVRFFM